MVEHFFYLYIIVNSPMRGMILLFSKNKMTASLLSSVLLIGLLAPVASAKITTARATIDIGSIGSSKYYVDWDAKTANSGQPRIQVSANVYFNSVKKDSDDKYGAGSVTISNSLSASNSVRGKWEINSTHREYDGSGKRTDIDTDYDSVQWDPAAARSLSSKDSIENDVLTEMKDSFSFDLDNFAFFRAVEVSSSHVSDSLKDIVVTAMDNQREGDIMPFVFVDESSEEAYILEKKADGTNQVTFIGVDEDGSWEVHEKVEKEGKSLK